MNRKASLWTVRDELPYSISRNADAKCTRSRLIYIALLIALLLSWLFLHSPNAPHSFRTTHTKCTLAATGNPACLIKAYQGAVAAENHRCSDIGVGILKAGGNAVDAAISATLCIGVVNMFSSGIGGGGFMTVYTGKKVKNGSSEVFTVDFRETSPSRSNASMYIDNPESAKWGGLSVGVPGEVKGLYEAHLRWGVLPWRTLVQPSVQLASGWSVDRELGRRIPWFADWFLSKRDWSDIFAPHGKLLREGDIIRRTNLSRTLAAVRDTGPDAFYKGPIADSIVRKVQSEGGILTHEDLLNYSVVVQPALMGTYRGRNIYSTHEPSSGPALLHMLNLVERYSFDKRTDVNVHRIVEAMKFGFAARTKISDSAFNNDSQRISELSTKSFADRIAKNLTDDRTHSPEYYNPEYDIVTDHGTSHVSTVDRDGMAVSMTSTVNYVFGSLVLDPETGIIMNNEQDDFSIPGVPNGFGLWPSPYNYPEPGKRPLSSITPVIVEQNGSFFAALGASGGSRIFGSVFQTLLNLDWGMDLSSSIEYGRLHDQLYPMILDIDNNVPEDFVESLRNRGHNVTVSDISRVAAVVQGVQREQDGTVFAASDSRKNGVAAGY